MAIAPINVPVTTTEPAKYNLLDTFVPETGPKEAFFGGIEFESEFCGIARPFTAVCADAPDLGSISVSVDIASVATITSTGLPDATYRIVWGDGDETAAEPEQLNETHDYTAAGDGSYVVQVYSNSGGVYAETTITVTNGVATGPFASDAVETKIADDGISYVTGDPIPIYHIFQCRMPGNGDPESVAKQRALRSLDLGASRAVEEGFQTVFATGAVDLSPATPVDPVRSLGILEQYAGVNYGGRPVIHMDRLMATRLYEDGAIERVDGHLETGLGSIVVAGAGYNADAALPSAVGAGNDWMYATGHVRIWQSPKTILSGLVPDNPYDNQFKSLAERVYIATYECFHAAIKVTEA
jgi:hypothetical protein